MADPQLVMRRQHSKGLTFAAPASPPARPPDRPFFPDPVPGEKQKPSPRRLDSNPLLEGAVRSTQSPHWWHCPRSSPLPPEVPPSHSNFPRARRIPPPRVPHAGFRPGNEPPVLVPPQRWVLEPAARWETPLA